MQFQVCTLGVKPPLLFTHVYECKVFASIVCKAACAVRVAGALNGTWRACRERVGGGVDGERDGERERAAACAEEGVSTLGVLPFRVSSKERRVEQPPRILQSRPHKRMWKRRWLSFPSTRSFCKYVKREPPYPSPIKNISFQDSFINLSIILLQDKQFCIYIYI